MFQDDNKEFNASTKSLPLVFKPARAQEDSVVAIFARMSIPDLYDFIRKLPLLVDFSFPSYDEIYIDWWVRGRHVLSLLFDMNGLSQR